jgi:hypothetical protein
MTELNDNQRLRTRATTEFLTEFAEAINPLCLLFDSVAKFVPKLLRTQTAELFYEGMGLMKELVENYVDIVMMDVMEIVNEEETDDTIVEPQ